jgi:hypothetical protein
MESGLIQKFSPVKQGVVSFTLWSGVDPYE